MFSARFALVWGLYNIALTGVWIASLLVVAGVVSWLLGLQFGLGVLVVSGLGCFRYLVVVVLC